MSKTSKVEALGRSSGVLKKIREADAYFQMLMDFKTLKEVNRIYNDVNTRNDLVPALIS